MSNMFCEAGIHYSWEKQEGLRECYYAWRHTPTGKTSERTIYLAVPQTLTDLLDHWNRLSNEWKYNTV